MWPKFTNYWLPPDFSVKSAPWILDKQLNVTSPHGWGQNTRFKQNPEPSWCLLTIPGVPVDNPRSACRFSLKLLPTKGPAEHVRTHLLVCCTAGQKVREDKGFPGQWVAQGWGEAQVRVPRGTRGT